MHAAAALTTETTPTPVSVPLYHAHGHCRTKAVPTASSTDCATLMAALWLTKL